MIFAASIDVGGLTKGSDVALWEQSQLHSVAKYMKPETLFRDMGSVDGVFIETQDHIKPGVPAEDIFNLLAITGGWYWLNRPWSKYIKPSEWNHSTAKPITHRRVWRALSPRERNLVASASNKTADNIQKRIEESCDIYAREGKVRKYTWTGVDALCAVGLGLQQLGRIQ